MRAAIVGVGSLGTILGAYISKAGVNIDLVDANREHVNALNRNGATITGKVQFNVPVRALTPEEMEGTYDLVFYMTKQTYNYTALNQLLPHLGPDSVVCTLQNGLPEPAVAQVIGAERTIGGTVGWGATWVGPGVSELTSDQSGLEFDVGSVDGAITDKVLLAQQYLQYMCKTNILANLTGVRWTKLLTNAAFSGMSAVLGCTFGEILDRPDALLCAQHLANECIHVAHALGVRMEPIFGLHMDQMLGFETDAQRRQTVSAYFQVWGPHRALKASMLQDLEKGRRCEIDAINGVVSKYGKETGTATAYNDKVVEIVHGIESGKYTYAAANLCCFETIDE